ncbi:MAG TPA: hypothetical protein VIJ59_01455 [Caulobacteraceae bacterium]
MAGEDTLAAPPTLEFVDAAALDVQTPLARTWTWPTFAVATILLLAVWIATRPYFGVIHDARLYSVQALNALYPGRFSSDLFFKYGSQDSFSAYTMLYKHVVETLGLSNADLSATIFGECIWLASAACLARTVFRRDIEFMAALTAAVFLYSGYGGESVFQYGEAFATPRLYAEALSMAAFALALRRRFVAAAAVSIAAAVLHPLMALVAVAVMVFAAARREPRVWILVAAAGCIGVAAVAAGVGPFSRAFVVFDPMWFQIVKQRCDFGLISEWRWWDFCQIAATTVTLFVALRLGTRTEQRLIASVLIVTLGGLVLSALGADVFHNLLAMNLQVWRVLWIATLAANAFLAIIVLRLPAETFSKEYFVVAIFFSGASRFVAALQIIGPLFLLVALTIVVVEWNKGARLGAAARVVARTAFGLACAGVASLLVYEGADSLHFASTGLRAGVAFCAIGLLVLAIRGGVTRFLAIAASFLLVSGVAFADQREPWMKYGLAPLSSDGLAAFVPNTGTVYWESEDGLQILWFKLHRPGYYSCLQGTGAMFYRGTATDYARRGQVLRTMNTRDFAIHDSGLCQTKHDADAFGPTDRVQLVTACRALPDLDTIILDRALPEVPTISWRAPAAQIYFGKGGLVKQTSTFFRYSCRDFR